MAGSRQLPPMGAADQRYLAQISAIVRATLGDTPHRCWLFGSRATGRARPASDFDLAIAAECDVSLRLSLAREALEESTVPLTVDLMDLADAPPELTRAVVTEGALLWTVP